MFTPSPFQLAVYEDIASGTGHTCINAVAGSGKTTTIVTGLQYVPAGCETIFMAFANANTEDLKRKAPKGVEVRSLNSYGMQCVARSFRGLTVNKFRVDDMACALSPELAQNAELRGEVTDCVSKAKGSLAGTAEQVDALIDEFGYMSAQNGSRPRFINFVLQLLEQCKDVSGGVIDFNDQIWLPIVLNLRQRQFDRVFLDETQDLNAAQIELTLRAVRPGGRIVAVGDPRQAIYAFRGADKNAFPNVVARLDAKLLPLSVCYRCCKAVVRLAQEIVPTIEAAPGAIEGEVRSITYKQMKKDVQPGDFVLSRSNAPLVALCLGLLAEGRSAMIQGRDVGASLTSLIKKAKAASVEELRNRIEEWGKKECARLAAKKRDIQPVEDKVGCILAISEGAATVADVVSRIETLFSDTKDTSRIVLSSTHRAKGLERDRVWLLEDTYRRRPGVEEENIFYVAITRARKVLVLVEGLR